MFRDDVKLIFKNVTRNERSILHLNLKKYPKQTQYPVIDLKMELSVNIVIAFKLQTIFTERSRLDVSQVLSLPLTTLFSNNKRAIS